LQLRVFSEGEPQPLNLAPCQKYIFLSVHFANLADIKNILSRGNTGFFAFTGIDTIGHYFESLILA
jgi:hypothetical protein